MRLSGKQTKRAVSILLCLALLVSTVAFALTVHAQEVEDLADTGADTYYLWGENSNSPNFNASSPTGTFTYDSSKGYYYYDLTGSSGDYCFVVSTISNSANYAVKTPAVQTVQNAGSYYLSAGNYHGFNCIHLWNPSGDTVRIYFTSTSAGLNAVKAGSDTTPTQPPTQPPTQASTNPPPTTGGNTNPTDPQPTTSGGSTSDKNYVYCENEAGWSSVYAYMWNSNTDNNAGWPGAAMTDIGGNIWRYEYPKNFANIIFSQNGSNQTSDLSFPGKGYCYNNKTKEWYIYDTSPLQVQYFKTDMESPQYNGVGITLSALGEGEGTVYYKFSVGTTVLSDYSTKNSVLWTPTAAGTYTITYEFKDAKGNTNKREKTYTIEDGSASAAPFIKVVTPAGGNVQTGKAVNVSVSAGGGKTGTNLLFYKYTVKNSTGNIVNVPYYKLNNTSYSFTPSQSDTYTLTVSVQASDNKTVERTYEFTVSGTVTPTEAVETMPPVTPTDPPAPTNPPTQPPTNPPAPTNPPTQPPTNPPAGLKGDADGDGFITITDVTYIQCYNVDIPLPTPINLVNADVDGDEEVTIIDATLIQRWLVGIIEKFPVES